MRPHDLGTTFSEFQIGSAVISFPLAILVTPGILLLNLNFFGIEHNFYFLILFIWCRFGIGPGCLLTLKTGSAGGCSRILSEVVTFPGPSGRFSEMETHVIPLRTTISLRIMRGDQTIVTLPVKEIQIGSGRLTGHSILDGHYRILPFND